MWNAMFDLHLSLGEKVIRAVVIYLFLVVALRLVGKRELSQLNTLDFVVMLAVANAVQNGLIGADNTVTGALVGATVLFIADGVLAFVVYRSRKAQRLIEGTPTLLVKDGHEIPRAMKKEELTHDDLLAALQSSGVETIDEARMAWLEPSGKVVVVPKLQKQATRQYDDLKERLDHLTELVERLAPSGRA
jgi:uncharacterized membrane protein YcaP (DUF421 family)